MRRKTIPCFLGLAAGILTAYAFECSRWLIIAAAFLLVSGYCCLKSQSNRRLRSAVIIFFVTGLVVMYFTGTAPRLSEGKGAELTGTVSSVEKKDEDYYLIEIRHDHGRTLARYFESTESVRDLVGRSIAAKGDISYPDSAGNPGCFDYGLYLKTKRIDTVMKCSSFEAGNVDDYFAHFLSEWRGRFEAMLKQGQSAHGDQYQIISAMLFGDKSSMDDDLYESFQRNGTAHILAVSGLHIGMIYALFSLVIGGRRKIRTNVIIALLLIAYAALAGFSPSVVRAVIMILLHIVSRLAHYRYDLVSAGCVTAALMLIWNPYQLFSAGFQMSFLAVMIMGFLMPVAENIKIPSGILKESFDEIFDLPSLEKKKLSEKVKQLLLPPLVIQAGMLPLTVYQFNYLPLMAFFANIPVVFLAGIIVPAGVVMFVLCGLGILGAGASSFSGILVKLLGLITDLMIKINDLLYADGSASPNVASPPLWAVLVFYSMMFFASSEWARIKWHRGMKRQWVATAAIIVITALAVGVRFGNDFVRADCVFVDVGQGACVHLRSPAEQNFLFDGGGKVSFAKKGIDEIADDDPEEIDSVGKKILKPYLLKNGVRKVDIAFVTHLDADHYRGIAGICRLGMVKKLGLHECLKDDEEKVLRETGMKRKDILYFSTGSRLKSKNFELDILGPVGCTDGSSNSVSDDSSISQSGSEKNENSMVARAAFRKKPLIGKSSEVSILVTGDIDETAENALVNAYAEGENISGIESTERSGNSSGSSSLLDCDIISVPHHGSRYSSSESFIRAVSPAAAVIQVGKNNMYGHPADEVIKRYEDAGSMVFRTDMQGAIGVFGRKIKTMKQE